MRAVKPPHTNGSGTHGAGGGRSGRLGDADRVRPVEHLDINLEGDVLNALVTYPEMIGPSGVQPSDFYAGANETICRVLLELVARGGRVDFAALQAALADARLLEQVGGAAYLLRFSERFPARDVDVKRLRVLARRRVVAATARRVARATGDELGAALRALREAEAELQLVEHGDAGPEVLTLEQHALSIRPSGERRRTGFPTMDQAFRGGVPDGSLLMFNGAPGSGKTAFATVLGDRWEREGCAVLYYAADQHPDGILVRLAQLAGFSREAFEAPGRPGEAVRADFARGARGRLFTCFDPFGELVPRTLEQAIRALERMAGDRPRVLIVDSLQTAPCESASLIESPRARVDAVIAVLKAAARRGATVITLSEAHRGTYGAKSKTQQSKGIASGKESSGIEFQADALLYFAAVEGEPNLIDVEISKNSRFGDGTPDVRLSLDRGSHRLIEVAPPDASTLTAAEIEAREAAAAKERAIVLKAIREHRELKSASAVYRKVKGRKADVIAMVRELLDEGVIAKVGGALRVQEWGGEK